MTSRALISVVLLVMASQPGISQFAQDYKFENYSIRNGVPSDFIETITQDKYGFIWLGTHNGLFRYDGFSYQSYTYTAENGSLPDNDARIILGDSSGKLWLGSRKGLYYFNYSGNNFIHIQSTSAGEPIEFASCPVLDNKNNLWFYSNAGICRREAKTGNILTVPVTTPRPLAYATHCLFSTAQGEVWFFSGKEIFCFDNRTSQFRSIFLRNNDGFIFKEGIQDIYLDGPDTLWIASLYGLYCLDIRIGTIKKFGFQLDSYSVANMDINHFSICKPLTGDSVLWCATNNYGIVLFDMKKKMFTRTLMHDSYQQQSIGGSFCYTVFTDRKGIVWVSHTNGLSKLDWRNQGVVSYKIKEMFDSNRVAPIRKVIVDPGTKASYWLVTWGNGVLSYDWQTKKVNKKYANASGSIQNGILFSYDALYDDAGTFWLGSDIGLSYFDRKKQAFISVQPESNTVLRMITDHRGQLWLGTEQGLKKFDPHRKTFLKIETIENYDTDLVRSPIYALCFDRQGHLFVGTQKGLFELDTATGKIKILKRPVTGDKTEFNINYIWGLAMDNFNTLWVTTRGGGFYRYDPTKNKYFDFPLGNGLTTRELRDIYVDSLQNVWLSSYEGIFRYDPRFKKFIRLTPEDGLDNYNISLGRWTILDNKIFSGSPGAFSVINLYAQKNDNIPVSITGIKIVDRPLYFNPDSLVALTIPVSYRDNIIRFEFNGLDYSTPSKVRYAYFLKGFDKTWHLTGDLRFVTYNNLSGGNYTFLVRTINEEGAMGVQTASVRIQVIPAFWQTLSFKGLLLALFAIGIALLVRKRIAHIRMDANMRQEQAQFQRKMAEMEMMALRTQMNPHFIFNCMNIIDGLILANRNAEAQEFLHIFSKLIRLILENSQHHLVPLQLDLDALKLYIELEMIRYSHQFRCTFDIEPALEKSYKIPPLLLQPYVENAIGHGLRHLTGKTGLLNISIKKEGAFVNAIIEDNGIGRRKSRALNAQNLKPHQPMGMHVTAKRIDLLKMTNPDWSGVEIIDIAENDDAGTRVIIRLPIEIKFDQPPTTNL